MISSLRTNKQPASRSWFRPFFVNDTCTAIRMGTPIALWYLIRFGSGFKIAFLADYMRQADEERFRWCWLRFYWAEDVRGGTE